MDENRPHSEQNDTEEPMSADDLAILQAFDALDTWEHADTPVTSFTQNSTTEFTDEDMLLLFAAEVDEDIGQMKRALSQLEEGDALDMTRIMVLHRVAHKIRGTAGAMECHAMASIARHIEDVVAQLNNRSLLLLVGLNVLVQAVLALEVTLQDLLTHGQESDAPLLALEHELEQFNITLEPSPVETALSRPLHESIGEEDAVKPSLQAFDEQDTDLYPPLPPAVHVEEQRFQRLLCHAELLVETRTPLENAQAQVAVALDELHAAQRQLQHLEPSLTNLALPPYTPRSVHNFPASSLVEHMLKEAMPQRSSLHGHTPKPRPHLLQTQKKTEWDALEFEQYSERDRTVYALRDAIAQVTIASTHVQNAYDNLYKLMQTYVQKATDVHTHLHLLRLTPLSVLLPRLQGVFARYAPDVSFEVTGNTTEVDKNILDTLASPLATLLHMCVTDTYTTNEKPQEVQRVWLHAHALGNEVTLEIGFSMTVQGGALDTVQPTMQQLGGTVELQRNTKGGISFFLRFPRSQGTVRGLLVCVGEQQVVIPFSQVQRVSDEQHEKPAIMYHLYKLLDFPNQPDPRQRITPIIILPQGRSRLSAGILVDEVISDVNVVVRPLASYLQRPGVVGTVLDGKGHVLLLLDIPELLKYYTMVRRHMLPEENNVVKMQKTQRLVLIADDSTLLRKSLAQTLERAKYATVEASDGLEALDLLTQNPPDVFLLDMEMPNLSGYDLLGIMHIYPELNDVKIIMLTSRTTEKYKQRAMALGAHVYLTKPCPPDVLLQTIEGLV